MQMGSMIKEIRFVNARSCPPLVAKGLIGVLLVVLFSTYEVRAQPGALDTSFGIDGKVTTDFGIASIDFAKGLAVQTDGKIVAAGTSNADGSNDFALARYNTDGSLDINFGSGGIVVTDFSSGASIDEANALAVQSDGKIVVAGTLFAGENGDFALARYNTDGSLDNDFGSGGIVLTDLSAGGSLEEAKALTIQSNGKIVVGGFSNAGGSADFALARYNPDGSIDNGFGSSGVVLTNFTGGSVDAANALIIQSDGKIVAAGISDVGGSGDFALARYNTDGSLDNGFGNGGTGKVLTDVGGNNDTANALSVQSDGKIVAAGVSDADGSFSFALARYSAAGDLDNGFGSGGVVLTDFSSGSSDAANALIIQSDGKIVAAGNSDAGGSGDFALARYNADGSLDTGFGSGGIVLTDFGAGVSIDPAFALAIQSDGKIVAAGSSVASGNENFALARYLDSTPAPTPSPIPTPTPGGNGFAPGDANGDGNINILDVTVILNDILEISSAPGNGDCNEDGNVNILDVTCVLNKILAA